jgi:hypothetical protein
MAEMTDAQLQKLGIASFGHRHLILKRIQALLGGAERVEVSPSSSASTMPVTGTAIPHTSLNLRGSVGDGGGSHLRPVLGGGRAVESSHPVHASRTAQPRLHHPTPRIHESQVTIGRKIGSGSVGCLNPNPLNP